MKRLWELAEQAHKRLPQMPPQEQKQVLELLNVRVTVLRHAEKTAGGRVLKPAQIRIEGLVNDQMLVSAEGSARDLAKLPSRRSSSHARAPASSADRGRARR